MRRDRSAARRGQPVLITDAPEDPEKELRRREIRYVIMMSMRALCLVGGAILVMQKPPLWQLWVVLCVIGMVLLPWLAVILANDQPPRKRQVPHAHHESGPLALPGQHNDRVIDAE